MFALHEEEKFKKLEIEPKKLKTDETEPVHRSSNKPFAKIDKVSVNSPAYVAVCVGKKLETKFFEAKK